MGINRIRLANGATGDPRVDARMQQTYQQNIADNQAQEAINQQNLNVGRERSRQRMRGMGKSGFQTPQAPGILSQVGQGLQNFGNTLTEGVQAGLNYGSIPLNFAAGVTGLPIGYTTQQMRDTMDAAAKASTRTGPDGGMYVGYEDLGAQEGPGGEFLGMNKDMTSAQRALALTSGDVEFNIDPATGEPVYDKDTLAYDFNQANPMSTGNEESGAITNFINQGGLMGQRVYTPMDGTFDPTMTQLESVNDIEKIAKASQYGTPTAAAAEPSAMPQGSPGQLNPTPTPDAGLQAAYEDFLGIGPGQKYQLRGNEISLEDFRKNVYEPNQKEYQTPDKPTMADVAGPNSDYVNGKYSPLITKDNFDVNQQEYYQNMKNDPSYIEINGTYYDKTDPQDAAEIAKKISFGEIPNMASGGRVGFQEGTDPKLTARQVAEQNPELNAMREKFFGTSYLDDIDQGNTGTVQYYTGLGDPTSLNYTPPVVETPAVDTSTPVVDGGGDGGGGIGISTGGSTDFEQSLSDQPMTGGVTNDNITVENIAQNQTPYDEPMDMSNPGASIENIIAQQNQTIPNDPSIDAFDINEVGDPALNPGSINVGDQSMAAGPFDYLQEPSISRIANPEIFDTYGASVNDPQIGDPGFTGYTPSFDTPEQTNAIGDAFNSVKDLGIDGIDKLKDSLVALGGKVKEGFDNTIEIGGKTIDLTKSLIGGALSLVSGIPGVSLLLNAIQEDPIKAATKDGLEEKGYGFDDIGRLTTGPMAGYSVESAFGDGIADATLDRIDKIENREAPQTEDSIEKVQDLYDFLGDVTTVKAAETAPQEDIDAISEDYGAALDNTSSIEDIAQDLATQQSIADLTETNIMDEFEPSDIQATDPNLEIPDRQRGDGGGNTGSTGMSDAQAASNREAGRGGQYDGGGGGGGSGGKIVCTMMNNSYGFGSFRNKIWLKHSRDMKPEYQIGYHKIFLPLVKLSKTNKVLKKTLEHIAVHRTIDIRQEARGKMHLLGRVYRKILEPICYIVGKYAK